MQELRFLEVLMLTRFVLLCSGVMITTSYFRCVKSTDLILHIK